MGNFYQNGTGHSNLLKVCLRTIMVFILISCLGIIDVKAQREIVLNTTGYGFDRNSDNGINPNQWQYINKFAQLTYLGQDASVTCVRLHIEWNQYEPIQGQYSGDKLAQAVAAIINLKPGMKVALHFPYQRPGYWNDSYLSQDEVARTSNGSAVQQMIAFTCPSMYSDQTKNKFLAFVDDALKSIKPYYKNILYVQMGNSASEEYLAPNLIVNNTTYVGLYENASSQSWRDTFLKKRYPGQDKITWGSTSYERQSAPLPGDTYWNTDMGRDFHRFAAWGLLRMFKEFHSLVKSHSSTLKVLYFISDLGGGQGNVRHMHTSSVPLALDLADGVYTSDGTNQYDLWRKISGVDVIKGSAPNKIAAIEFDPEDLGEPKGQQTLDPALADEWIDRAFKHGVNYVHLAMHFHDAQMSYVSRALATVKAKYIMQPYSPPARKAARDANIFPEVFNDRYLFDDWYNQGGGNWASSDVNPVSIKMQDYGYWDNVWNTDPYLPCNFVVNQQTLQPVKPGETVTIKPTCQGEECDRVFLKWDGAGVNNVVGSSITFTAPSAEGIYTYTTQINRSGCPQQNMTTSLKVSQPLPVTLITFEGQVEETKVKLHWKTAQEINSDRFEIEKMNADKSWYVIGNISSTGVSHVSQQNYQFVDHQPQLGENIYRLKMVDADGSYAYSRLLAVLFSPDSGPVLYPNPARAFLKIEDATWSQVSEIQIFNKSGQIVNRPGKSDTAEINIQQLPEDQYTLQLLYNTGQKISLPFVKIN
ncbi:T9SS type A sorting domain-containing protein [Dyadobacter tibetensis]|uniref:T9SS type A sorting domain-containing protein n=1 Tax=Dyadobacter tibetensis TaxID=1211851 RepID=UPI0004715429|nr:T9SS type A sorting domain-containing protein [Dyadobacter tibetensis]